ncbi:MAG: hypothetical protein AB7V55_06520 [Oscillospiraceae bacterium]
MIDYNQERRTELAAHIARCAGALRFSIEPHDAREVFQNKFDGADLIFLGVEGMADVEAGRKLARFFPGIPLVVASSSGDYSVEAFALGARHYLLCPFDESELYVALAACGLPVPPQA